MIEKSFTSIKGFYIPISSLSTADTLFNNKLNKESFSKNNEKNCEIKKQIQEVFNLIKLNKNKVNIKIVKNKNDISKGFSIIIDKKELGGKDIINITSAHSRDVSTFKVSIRRPRNGRNALESIYTKQNIDKLVPKITDIFRNA